VLAGQYCSHSKTKSHCPSQGLAQFSGFWLLPEAELRWSPSFPHKMLVVTGGYSFKVLVSFSCWSVIDVLYSKFRCTLEILHVPLHFFDMTDARMGYYQVLTQGFRFLSLKRWPSRCHFQSDKASVSWLHIHIHDHPNVYIYIYIYLCMHKVLILFAEILIYTVYNMFETSVIVVYDILIDDIYNLYLIYIHI